MADYPHTRPTDKVTTDSNLGGSRSITSTPTPTVGNPNPTLDAQLLVARSGLNVKGAGAAASKGTRVK